VSGGRLFLKSNLPTSLLTLQLLDPAATLLDAKSNIPSAVAVSILDIIRRRACPTCTGPFIATCRARTTGTRASRIIAANTCNAEVCIAATSIGKGGISVSGYKHTRGNNGAACWCRTCRSSPLTPYLHVAVRIIHYGDLSSGR